MIYYYQIRNHHYKTEAVPHVTCPLCHTTGGISMSVQQKYVWMIGPMAPSAKYAIAHCAHCENFIPKVKWTDEMDEAYQLLKKDVRTPRRFYRGLIVLPLIVIAFIGVILSVISISSSRQKRNAAAVKDAILHPDKGDIFQLIHSSGGNTSYTYLKVDRSEGDSMYLLPSNVQKTDMKDWDDVPVEAGTYRQQPLAVSISKAGTDEMFTFGSGADAEFGIVYGVWKEGKLIKKY